MDKILEINGSKRYIPSTENLSYEHNSVLRTPLQ